ncbi:DUF983 domain-containing protein [Gymnodinialimonas sp.]
MTDRSIIEAIARGSLCRCPSCGKGPLFQGFLTVNDMCPRCGEALHHHRADDAPPYIVTLIVGHVVVGLMLTYEMMRMPPMWVHAIIFLPMAVLMSLALLRPVKGALVGFQWAAGMHGFHPDGERWT